MIRTAYLFLGFTIGVGSGVAVCVPRFPHPKLAAVYAHLDAEAIPRIVRCALECPNSQGRNETGECVGPGDAAIDPRCCAP